MGNARADYSRVKHIVISPESRARDRARDSVHVNSHHIAYFGLGNADGGIKPFKRM